ncbi:type IV pilin protein [Flavobacterium gawalongense]|uniref:Prepilin-type N-terminal cleavage/methylation domain-containing protein n=1 Tax=Flavobacterium gawalongense TaxID=2594432 RepID=A0A553BMZ4_9FLAO|nr:type II secretion system protein [Flavobacterium gawalongense]TRW97016.1 prepilin-type N-terminal cleavage/methylation domain-containing protein [Flavobacterium gawalongense]TRX01488.1 prepilin-type N-terminal cleavage/methylation domain-containing protein [Flavobacterium gawalongense]TRX09625.1 prepilin-type N-terminal cleavage/methylation domain-containing protein [Flavobacterium gawalongense]TRX10891.1 prepilin-type N-terminal cleavage/methylation domain-containing protein [Flavobacterium
MLDKIKKQLQNTKKASVKAYSLTEILIVLCIIGILLLMVLPNQTSVIAQAKAIEAQAMLNQIYGLEKSYFYRHSKYSSNLEELGFEQELTVDEGGQAVYKIEIIEASNDSFSARATAASDLDSDGSFNTWEIDNKQMLNEVTKE